MRPRRLRLRRRLTSVFRPGFRFVGLAPGRLLLRERLRLQRRLPPVFRFGLVRLVRGSVLLQGRLGLRLELDDFAQPLEGLGTGRLLVVVEPVEHFHQRRDRLDVASADRLARRPERRLEPRQLQERMVRVVLDLALLERLGDDLARAPRGDSLLAGDLLIGPAVAQPGKNALPPRRLAEARQRLPGRRRRRLLHPFSMSASLALLKLWNIT